MPFHCQIVRPGRFSLTTEGASSPVEIIYVGTFHLADRGRVLEITPDHLEQMVSNYDKLDGPDRVAININHNSDGDTLASARAVGWLQDLYVEVRDERISLVGLPRWTEDAREAIANEEFKFLSAEIDFHDVDTLTGEEVGCRLVGIALTNIPAIPELAPVHLTAIHMTDLETKGRYTIEHLRRSRSLIEQVNAIVSAFYRRFPDSNLESFWIEDVQEECVIVRREDPEKTELYRVEYTTRDEGVAFTERGGWIEVEHDFVPVETTASPTANTDTTAPETAALTDGTTMEQSNMNEETLRELLGIDAEASIEEALTALLNRPTQDALDALQQENEVLKTQNAELTTAAEQVEETHAALTARTAEVETLTTRADAFESQATDLGKRVEKLEGEKRQRAAEDRIQAALTSGRVDPAMLDREDGHLRTMALNDPDGFDKLMRTLPGDPGRFRELTIDGDGTPDASIDALFNAIDAELEAHPELSRADARKLVFAARPDLEALTKKE